MVECSRRTQIIEELMDDYEPERSLGWAVEVLKYHTKDFGLYLWWPVGRKWRSTECFKGLNGMERSQYLNNECGNSRYRK